MSCRHLTVLLGLFVSVWSADLAGADDKAQAYIISPTDGAVVTSPVTVVFGLKGMGVAPAGTDKANTGHHHLLIDTGLPPLDENIPADENHIHFGGGQTEVTINLAPGNHTLQLLLGDMNHIPHNPPVFSRRITITVKE
ncbi:DUF4399 domain-containing protein [Kordiimonas lipolytica]|uniref:DUF4399 domain-containing protein n=1 Tax=Kordiimonas lipolytica TaxID=1662421 RepID=A0ABV8UC73_9PROT